MPKLIELCSSVRTSHFIQPHTMLHKPCKLAHSYRVPPPCVALELVTADNLVNNEPKGILHTSQARSDVQPLCTGTRSL